MSTISRSASARAEAAALGARLERWWRDAGHALRRWRRAAKARLPYVRRREYAKLSERYRALADGVGLAPRDARDARIRALRPVVGPLRGDVCLFVCHQRGPSLQSHVLRHLRHLQASGIEIVLILNADDVESRFELDDAVLGPVRGVYVRENVGFDFAAWAHAHSLLHPLLQVTRLFLINDSIAGPLDAAAFARMIARVRASRADLVGLTEAMMPLRHLQSYFLVFQRRLAEGQALASIFDTVLCFDEKRTVIDVYETRLTRRLTDAGYACEALFPALSDDPHATNDTYFRWGQLLDLGFPYIKVSVLRKFRDHPRLRALAADWKRGARSAGETKRADPIE